MKYTLVWVEDESAEPPRYLWTGKSGDEPATIDQVTLEQLADMCDYKAEARNNHDFTGTHRVLAAILHRAVGRAKATEIMWEVATYGGLDYASGVGVSNVAAAWDDLKIPEPFRAWSLHD